MKSYTKTAEYSYTLGVFPTIQLLKTKPETITRVILSSMGAKNSGVPLIYELCEQYNIQVEINDKIINKLSKKGNCFAIGVFNKYTTELEDNHHIVLVNPGDMGNLGTIMRTMIGFDYKNLVIIKPGVDAFDPKVIRASMGAIFDLNIQYFDSFEEYYKLYNSHDIYPLMLKGAKNIHTIQPNHTKYHTLVFGNESSGLPDEYLNYGQSVFIPHSNKIDSLNLSMALGITLTHFSKSKFEKMTELEFLSVK